MVWPVVEVDGGAHMLPATTTPESMNVPDNVTVRAMAAGARESGELAFTANLVALKAESPALDKPQAVAENDEGAAAAREKTAGQFLEGGSTAPAQPADPIPPQPAAAATAALAAASHGATASPRPRGARNEEAAAAPQPPPGSAPAVRPLAQTATVLATQPQTAQAKSGGAGTAPPAETRAAADLSEPAQSKPGTPAREIRLELAGGDQRVEVKLSERAGELKVAVRAQDSHLAERLRSDLPQLSSRLEQSGVRAETWRPSQAAGSDWRNAQQVSTAGSGLQQDEQSRQQGREQQREGESRRPRVTEENEQPKEKGQDFEWFLSATQ